MLVQIKAYILKHKIELFLAVVLSVIFFVTRFYNVDQRIPMGWDQENFSNKIYNIVENGDFTLLGPRVNNDLGFYLAPYFEYAMIPLYLLTGLHPIAMKYLLYIAGIALVGLTICVFRRVLSWQHALFILALWIINPLALRYDVVPWWPLLIPIGTIFTIGGLHFLYTYPKKTWLWIGFGALQGFFMNMHFQYSLMIFFSIVSIYLINKQHPKALKNSLLSLAVFAVMFTPLLVFDLRNNFLNTKLFFGFFWGPSDMPKDYLSLIPVLENFLQPYTVIKHPALVFALLGSVIAGSAYFARTSKDIKHILFTAITATLLLMLAVFSYYGKRPSEYYFIFSLPLILMVIAEAIVRFKLQFAAILLVFALSYANYEQFLRYTAPDEGSLTYMEDVVFYLEDTIGKEGYNITYSGQNIDNGFIYLFRHYEFAFTEDFENDPLVEIVYPIDDRNVTTTVGRYGIVIPDSLTQQNPERSL